MKYGVDSSELLHPVLIIVNPWWSNLNVLQDTVDFPKMHLKCFYIYKYNRVILFVNCIVVCGDLRELLSHTQFHTTSKENAVQIFSITQNVNANIYK